MAAPKFADLPGIVWNEPEVYETSNTPEGHQAELEAAWNEPEVYETGDMLKGDQAELEVIVELEKRLAQLEATVQCKPISQNLLLVEPMGSSLLETAQILQAKVNILDEVMLDQIEARLKSILGKVKEIAEHEATLQCANSQSKIHQTYELMQHWDPIASSLPDVVQYLLTLRDLHKEATQVGQVLEDMETMQKEIADALQVNTFLLEVVQKTMKEFLAFVEENVAETEASIRKLQK
nr:dynactin subunit 2-like isoform X11 [Anser cygnoides]